MVLVGAVQCGRTPVLPQSRQWTIRVPDVASFADEHPGHLGDPSKGRAVPTLREGQRAYLEETNQGDALKIYRFLNKSSSWLV